MARMFTATDVEDAAARGQPLALAPGDRLTPLARDRAKELGVALTGGGMTTQPAGTIAARAAGQPGGFASGARMSPVAAAGAMATAVVMPAAGAMPAARAATGSTAPGVATARPLVLPPSGALYRRSALGPQARRPVNPAIAGGSGGRPLAGVVGAGHVGAMTALRLAQSDLFDQVSMVDVVPGLAEGLALDMWHGAGLYGFSTRLRGSDDLAALAGADYIVITAGKPRQPGMSRTDLTAVNAAIVETVAKAIRMHSPRATLVVVSNPLEEMTHLAARYSGFPEERVLGMAGVLDSARFRALVGLTGKVTPAQVHALALGSHGPEMVIPLSQATAAGQPIESLLDATTLAAIVERTRESGGEVVKLLQKGSAYFSPAESAATMVRAMARNSDEVLAACVRSGGAYGTVDTRVGLPVRLHAGGLLEIAQLPLREDELRALREAAARIAARIGELPAPAAEGSGSTRACSCHSG